MSFTRELKRRNVFRVGIAYLVVGWLLLQVSDTLVPALHLPEWFQSGVAFLLILGFPVALLFAWAFELTPEGIKRQKDVVSSESAASQTSRKLDITIIAMLALALAYFIWESRFAAPSIDHELVQSAQTTETVVPSGPITIAVLPFINISADPEQEYFSDGITEEILNDLAAIRELAVTSRTSAFAFKGKSVSIPEIARELGVGHVLEGSVRKSGSRLRITAQLIEVDSDSHLWSETYDRDLTDIFAVQDEISESIAEALKLNLLGDGIESTASRPVIPKAYDLYLRGLDQFSVASLDSYVNAVEYFEQSLEIDPLFVRARAGLGWALAWQVTNGILPPEVYLPRISEHILSGLETDPNNAGLIALTAQLEYINGDLEQAEIYFQRALELEPPYYGLEFWYPLTLEVLGKNSAAMQFVSETLVSDPLNISASLILAHLSLVSGDFDKFFAITSRVKLIAPSNPYPLFNEGYVKAVHIGDLSSGLIDLEKGLKLDPGDYEVISMLAILCHDIGDTALANTWTDLAGRLSVDATTVLGAKAYGLALGGDVVAAREISLQALANHKHFDRWWGGFLTLRLAVSELLERGDAAKAVEMILQAEPEWAAFKNKSPVEAPELSSNPGYYNSGAVQTNSYLPDFARALRAAGDVKGADNVLAHMGAFLAWRAEHGLSTWETNVAELAALQGQVDEAIEALERAERNRTIYAYWHHKLTWNSIFDEIRTEPRFEALVQRVGAEMKRQNAAHISGRSAEEEVDEI